MRIFVDVDGTLTQKQCARSAFKVPPRQDVLDKVRKLIAEGHEVILWTGNTEYAERVAKHYGLDVTAIGKPQLIVDNQVKRWGNRLKDRTVTPEAFLEMEIK